MTDRPLFTVRASDVKSSVYRGLVEPDTVTVWRQHNCRAQHRTPKTFMKCAVPRAAWVMGSGEFATVAWCGTPTVELHDTLDQAVKAKALIDSTGCGGRCQRRHQIVRVNA
jgi:hypothetical protein